MNKIEQGFSSVENESEKYLKAGAQTELSEDIMSIAETLRGNFEEKVSGVLDIASRLRVTNENKNSIFRKRTANQILSDGFVTGCTDIALVSIALFRAVGIPAKYIEAIDANWLQEGGEHISGHVYVRVFDGTDWIIIDPMKKSIDVDIERDSRVTFKEGLDSWDIGIDSFESLSESFNDFRNQNYHHP